MARIDLSVDALAYIAKCPEDRATVYVDALNLAMERNRISTPQLMDPSAVAHVALLRISHFLAQIIHESDYLRTTEEYADGSAYEKRRDLGNFKPGDGGRFKGRGLIQLTGRANYAMYSRAVGLDLLSEPHLVAEPPLCVDVAGWFWLIKDLARYADADDAVGVTKRINGAATWGPPSHLARWLKILERAKHLLHVELATLMHPPHRLSYKPPEAGR